MTDPVVIITGAGAGIGRALATAFSRDGFKVGGVGRSPATLEATAAECAAGRFAWRAADVGDWAGSAHAIAELEAELGPVFALVANAAVYPRGHFLDQPPEVWDQVMAVNVCGVANACRAVLPGMFERGRGRIVMVGSLADLSPLPGSSAYSVSKGALHVLNRALAAEIAEARYADVLINEFMPTATRTAMSAAGDDPMAAYPMVRRLIDLPEGGPSGRAFWRGKEYRAPQTLRSRLRQAVRRLVGGL